jgi:hypothetical protein
MIFSENRHPLFRNMLSGGDFIKMLLVPCRHGFEAYTFFDRGSYSVFIWPPSIPIAAPVT